MINVKNGYNKYCNFRIIYNVRLKIETKIFKMNRKQLHISASHALKTLKNKNKNPNNQRKYKPLLKDKPINLVKD